MCSTPSSVDSTLGLGLDILGSTTIRASLDISPSSHSYQKIDSKVYLGSIWS